MRARITALLASLAMVLPALTVATDGLCADMLIKGACCCDHDDDDSHDHDAPATIDSSCCCELEAAPSRATPVDLALTQGDEHTPVMVYSRSVTAIDRSPVTSATAAAPSARGPPATHSLHAQRTSFLC